MSLEYFKLKYVYINKHIKLKPKNSSFDVWNYGILVRVNEWNLFVKDNYGIEHCYNMKFWIVNLNRIWN